MGKAFGFWIWEALEGKFVGGRLLKWENELLQGKCWREIAEGGK
jgi:hypothetical protein